MKTDLFLVLLLLASIIISLITEAAKKMMSNFASNGLAAIVSVIVGGALGVGYCYTAKLTFGLLSIAIVLALVVGSWLVAMLGYDKIKQAILQRKGPEFPIEAFAETKKLIDNASDQVPQIDIVPDNIPTYPPSSIKKE